MKLNQRMMKMIHSNLQKHASNNPNENSLDDIMDLDAFEEEAIKEIEKETKEEKVIEGNLTEAFIEYYDYHLNAPVLYSTSEDFEDKDGFVKHTNTVYLIVKKPAHQKLMDNLNDLSGTSITLPLEIENEGSTAEVGVELKISWTKAEGGYKFKTEFV